ncbi:Dabb family protein [Aquabacter cavernae]|uniref:Dabb family protein n=1 Tax=Aquabacter cavernae TaxID=2496029 RepID=UPI000F8E6D05|nr:Dabb family protein [Aquabacter cavernae]
MAPKMITHVVLLRFPAITPQARIRELTEPFLRLPERIPGLVAVSVGPNTSPEGLDAGYRHGLIMRFVTAADRDVYLTHPAHVAVAAPLVAALERGTDDVVVFDMETD